MQVERRQQPVAGHPGWAVTTASRPSPRPGSAPAPRFSVPYQVEMTSARTGKHLPPTKRQVRFVFGLASLPRLGLGRTGPACRGSEHEVQLLWSLASGKRRILLDGREVHSSVGPVGKDAFSAPFDLPGTQHVLVLSANQDGEGGGGGGGGGDKSSQLGHGRRYGLTIDGLPFAEMLRIYELGGPKCRQMHREAMAHAEAIPRAELEKAVAEGDAASPVRRSSPRAKEGGGWGSTLGTIGEGGGDLIDLGSIVPSAGAGGVAQGAYPYAAAPPPPQQQQWQQPPQQWQPQPPQQWQPQPQQWQQPQWQQPQQYAPQPQGNPSNFTVDVGPNEDDVSVMGDDVSVADGWGSGPRMPSGYGAGPGPGAAAAGAAAASSGASFAFAPAPTLDQVHAQFEPSLPGDSPSVAARALLRPPSGGQDLGSVAPPAFAVPPPPSVASSFPTGASYAQGPTAPNPPGSGASFAFAPAPTLDQVHAQFGQTQPQQQYPPPHQQQYPAQRHF
jgi:hypothetical protein